MKKFTVLALALLFGANLAWAVDFDQDIDTTELINTFQQETLDQSPDYRVITKDCPAKLNIFVDGITVDMGKIDPNDKDLGRIFEAIYALSKIRSFEFRGYLVGRANGKCYYGKYPANYDKAAIIYTRSAKNLIYVQYPLTEKTALRVYAQIESYNVRSGLSLKKQGKYGIMAYFSGKPDIYYGGGPEVRPIGFATTMEAK